MEEWQKEHIRINLPKLLSLTDCNAVVLSHLRSVKALGISDVDILVTVRNTQGQMEQSALLYKFMQGRIGGYENLTFALFQCNQSGAVDILLEGFWSQNVNNPLEKCGILVDFRGVINATAYLHGQPLKLQQIIKDFNVDNLKEVFTSGKHEKDYYDIFIVKRLNFVLASETVPKHPSNYINRWISNRIKISPAIFQVDCSDIFVIRDIERTKLTELANPHSTSTSGTQIFEITSRFILLEDQLDWEEIRELTTEPIHLIKFENDSGTFILEESLGNSKVLANHVVERRSDEKSCISEETLIENVQQNETSCGACICDTPGMGKTLLLVSIANKVLKLHPNQIVVYFPLTQFISYNEVSRELENIQLTPSKAIDLIVDYISPTKLSHAILLYALKRKLIVLNIFVDGFDEVSESTVNWSKQFLRNLAVNKPNIKLFVASRPHYRNDLEQSLGFVAYDILPFNEENQQIFLETHWKQKLVKYEEKRLKDFSSICLKHAKKTLSRKERDILGIPLQCFIMAEINIKKARVYSDPRRKVTNEETFVTFNSIYEMYKDFIHQRFFGDLSPTVRGKKSLTEDVIEENRAIKNFHVWQALRVLFPKNVSPAFLEQNFHSGAPTPNYLSFGILELQSPKHTIGFVHRTFAEFLVAEFLASFMSGQMKLEVSAIKENVVDCVIESLSTRIPKRKESYVFTMNWFYPFEIFRSYDNVKLCLFKYPIIVHFIDSYMKLFEAVSVKEKLSELEALPINKITSYELYKLIQCCISENQMYILRYINQILKITSKYLLQQHKSYFLKEATPTEMPDEEKELCVNRCCLLFIAASQYSNLSIAKTCFQLFDDCFQCNVNILFQNTPLWLRHPIQAAIQSLDYELVEYFVDKVSLEGRSLLYHCVENTNNYDLSKIKKILSISRLLLTKNRKLLYEVSYSPSRGRITICNSPLVACNVSLEVMKFLINEGADINSKLGDDYNIAFAQRTYWSSTDYNEWLRYLLEDCNASHLFTPDESKEFCPIRGLLSSSSVRPDILENVLRLQSSNLPKMELNNYNKDSLLLSAVTGNHPISILEKLIKFESNLNMKDEIGWNLLHIAAHNHNLELLKYFYSLGLPINDVTNEGNSLLHQAAGSFEIVEWLLANGADVNCINVYGDSVAHEAAKHMTAEYFDQFVTLMIEKLNFTDIFVLKNKKGRSPLHERIHHRRETYTPTMERILDIPGLEINAVDEFGLNLIQTAVCERHNINELKTLVKYGANYNLVTKSGNNILHLMGLHWMEDGLDVMGYFVTLGVNVNQLNCNGETPLDMCVGNRLNVFQMVKAFVKFGAEYLRVNNEGKNVMHLCVRAGFVEAVRYFISLSVSVTQCDNNNMTPISLATALYEKYPSNVHFEDIVCFFQEIMGDEN